MRKSYESLLALESSLYTTQQIAAKFGVTDRTIRSLCESGKLEAVKFHDVWFIDFGAAQDYVREHRPDLLIEMGIVDPITGVRQIKLDAQLPSYRRVTHDRR